MCKKDEEIVMPNFAALRAAVFQLSTKNLRGGGYPPPPSVRGLRSGTVTLHVRTGKVGSNLLLHATILIDLHQNTKFERDGFSPSRDLE